MKTRIVGTLIMLVVLGFIGYSTGAFDSGPKAVNQSAPATNPSDADFKNLQIN